jgi:hypothetical protein
MACFMQSDRIYKTKKTGVHTMTTLRLDTHMKNFLQASNHPEFLEQVAPLLFTVLMGAVVVIALI